MKISKWIFIMLILLLTMSVAAVSPQRAFAADTEEMAAETEEGDVISDLNNLPDDDEDLPEEISDESSNNETGEEQKAEIEDIKITEFTMESFSLMGGDVVAVVVGKNSNGNPYGESVEAALSTSKGVYATLEDALEAAQSGETVILLAEDYTIATDATIKSGVLLLLPCEDTYKAYETNGFNPDGTKANGTTGISSISRVFTKLTIPTGIKLTISGDMLVNAVTGRPSGGHFDMDINGGYAEVVLEGDIEVTSGGNLEVCGLLNGPGQITALSGSAVHDLYIVRNWRGGTQASNMVFSSLGKGIFYSCYPMNEIDCHNIKSDILIEYGATFSGTVKMYADYSYHYTRFPQVDKSNGLIRPKPGGYILKTYDEAAGRTIFTFYGGATASRSTLTIVGMNLSTGGYIYPVDGDITFRLNSGDYFIDETFKFLTGAEVYVESDATLTINSNNRVAFYDKFEDINNYSTTNYPNRPPAILSLAPGARFNVNDNAYFAGEIRSTANAPDSAQVNFAPSSVMGMTTYESIKMYESPYTRPLEFEARLLNVDGETSFTPSPGKTYFYSDGWGGGDIPSGIGDASLSGKIVAQGRKIQSGIIVRLMSGDEEKYQVMTNPDGTYSFDGVDEGVYTLTASCDKYLKHTRKNITVSGETATGTITLLGGDINGSGMVDISDLNLLIGNYQKAGVGDINASGLTDISDLNLIISNYQKKSTTD